MAIFKRYDPNMFPAGCDEGYLKCVLPLAQIIKGMTKLASITAYCEEHSISADDCVQEMRRVVFEETKLTVSAGIAPNKVGSFLRRYRCRAAYSCPPDACEGIYIILQSFSTAKFHI